MLSFVLHYMLWWLAPIVQVCLMVCMVRRGQRRRFPAFFAYTAIMLVFFVAGVVSYRLSYNIYFYVYWVGQLLVVGAEFAVMHEIFRSIFLPYESLRELGDVLFKWSAMVLVLVAVVCAVSGHAAVDNRAIQTIVILERSVRVMQVGLVLFLFLFASHVGLTTRSHIFGLALGFGIFAAIQLAVVTVWALMGTEGNNELGLLSSGAYNVACCLWLQYLRTREPERVTIDYRARSAEYDLALSSISQSSQQSFLPMIENAVERVLRKRGTEMQAGG